MVTSNIIQVKLNFVIIEAKLETKGPNVHCVHDKAMPNVTFILNAAFLAGNLITTRAFCGGDSHAH